MIKTTKILIQELSNYKNPTDKIKRLVKENKLIPVVKGLYETDKNISGQYLAQSILGPSYLSFDYALAYHGLIPEAVYTFTNASFEKRKTKEYKTPFGLYVYQDVPSAVYSLGVQSKIENGYSFKIASPEKALCDKLYSLSPIKNQKELVKLLFEDLRIDENEFAKLNIEDIKIIAEHYGSRNVTLLSKLMGRL